MQRYKRRCRFTLLALWIVAVGLACRITIPLGADPDPASDISTSSLLLSEEPFPEGWSVELCSNCEKNGESSRIFGVADEPENVDQWVFHFSEEREAKGKFRRYQEADLVEATHEVRRPSTVFRRPPEMDYRSLIADEQFLGCGVDIVPKCTAGLRYNNYFVYFTFDLSDSYYRDYLDEDEVESMLRDEGGLTLAQVEDILHAMDIKYAELFDVSLPAE